MGAVLLTRLARDQVEVRAAGSASVDPGRILRLQQRVLGATRWTHAELSLTVGLLEAGGVRLVTDQPPPLTGIRKGFPSVTGG
ncbi:hypothetical protein [Streptomyces sp. Agncl-13]|uniref:hypothetical protein n=1 Tax=Streptomyces sp. Agncl-13 TaxID=3400628 RepID=UPI003A857377